MSRRKENTMKNNNRKSQKHHQKNNMHVLEEIGFGLIPELIDTADTKPVTDYVTLPRYEYDNLIGKVTVYDLLRDMIARNEYISADSLRNLLGIAKRKEQAE